MKANVKLVLIISIAFFLFLEDGILLYNRIHSRRTVLGQGLNNTDVSRMSHKEIIAYIKNKYDKNAPLQLQSGKKVFQVTKSDIHAFIDYQETLNVLNKKGRTNNPLSNTIEQNIAFMGLSNVKVLAKISKPMLTLKALEIADQINLLPSPLMPNFAGDIHETIPQYDGVKVDTEALSKLIASNIFTPPDKPIHIPVMPLKKSYPTVDLNAIRKEALDKTQEPITLSEGGVSFTLTSQDLRSILTLAEDQDSADPRKNILALKIDHEKLNRKLDPIAVKVEAATNAEFNDHDTRSAIYGQFYTNTRRIYDIPIGPAKGTEKPAVLGMSTNSNEKVAYLTFDDGPNIVFHPLVLDILKEKGVKATFYLVGSNSKLYPSTTKRTVDEGHAIGDHSLTHAYLPKLLSNQIFDEIKTTQDILSAYIGKKITMFRPPYGGTNKYVQKYANDLHMKTNFWTVDPRDWSDPPTDVLVKRVVDETKGGSVILMHSNHFATVKALPIIIDRLRARGFQFKVQE